MKKNNFLFVFIALSSCSNILSFYGGSYTPNYQGGGNAGNITPSRFAPVGYTKNTGWGSADTSACQQGDYKYREPRNQNKFYLQDKPRIRQK